MQEWKQFSLRSFISISLFLLFLILAVSGAMMYLRPEGSIARWSGWKLLGLTKKAWEGVHISLALMFVILALVHIILNWKPLLGYLRRRIAGALFVRKELAAAALFVAAVLALSVIQWRPLAGLMALRTTIKDGQNILAVGPPALDADKLPLTEIARLVEADASEFVLILNGQGLDVQGPDDTLEQIAGRAKTTPEQVYLLILKSLEK